jgi:protein disulfide-isomerase A1
MMNLSIVLAFVLFSFSSAAISKEGGVLVLDDANFDEAVTTYPQMLVEFYAPWCGHCKKLAPEWEKAAATLADAPIKLAKVDATEAKALGSKYEIKGFPTIKYFNQGSVSDYSGGRVEAEIVQWVSKRSGPPYKTIATADDLTKMKDSHDAFVLGVFSSIDSAAAKSFISVASKDDNNEYAITTETAVRSELGISTDTVVVLKNFDDLRNDMPVASFDEAEVNKFILKSTTPLVFIFSDESSKKIFGSSITKHVLFFTDHESSDHTAVFNEYKKVAAEYSGELIFVNVPITESRVADYFGVTSSNIPYMVLGDMSNGPMKKYNFEKNSHKAEDISAFCADYKAGKLTPSLKSESVESSDQDGPVVVVRGTSFNEIVIDNDKDVLVEFYAPWCGHCKQLAPIYEELGTKMKTAQENIVIAKMDMTANEIDVKGVEVKGFPTLFFFESGKKDQPKQYDGGRDIDSFVKYLGENAHHKFNHEEL